eukprot:815948-Prymnesium_polylepis.1
MRSCAPTPSLGTQNASSSKEPHITGQQWCAHTRAQPKQTKQKTTNACEANKMAWPFPRPRVALWATFPPPMQAE